MKRPRLTLSTLAGVAASAAIAPLGFGALAGGVAACNVEVLDPGGRPAVANSCKVEKDCGTNGMCTGGACFSRSGNIDEVLLEIVPEASSPFGGVTFLSMQAGLRRGDRARNIALPGLSTFPVQVQVNGEDIPSACGYLPTGKQTIAARIQFIRTGSIGGVPIAGLANGVIVTVDTEQNSPASTSGFSKNVSLVPGFYDIYVLPVASSTCQIAPKLWRGVEVARDGQVVAWAAPATLELSPPLSLAGKVQRKGGTLADWQVEIIDPQDGRIISTSARLGATTDASPLTNFLITYQPLAYFATAPQSSPNPGSGLIIRLKPPKDAESTVPAVYLDLDKTDLSGTGQVNLELSGLPTAAQLVTVSGQVRGPLTNDGIRATLKFFNSSFQSMSGLPASFGPAVTTDATGHYTTKLFPGDYRIIVIPEGASDDGRAVVGANPARPWALTKRDRTIGQDATQQLDIMVALTRILEGVASAGNSGTPAQGATLEGAPLMDTSSDVLHTVISPSVSPARVSVPVDDTNGKFSLVIDPGDFDLSLKPAPGSNFAWWVLPGVTVAPETPPGQTGIVNPQLLYPIPVEGTITVVTQGAPQPLRNATVQAYARTPGSVTSPQGGVAKVGTARTDDMGRYYIALPPGFGDL